MNLSNYGAPVDTGVIRDLFDWRITKEGNSGFDLGQRIDFYRFFPKKGRPENRTAFSGAGDAPSC
jgi:hypothetical protein